jgi:CRP/FNR family cyclic AMP-dependent transcriptional regulator
MSSTRRLNEAELPAATQAGNCVFPSPSDATNDPSQAGTVPPPVFHIRAIPLFDGLTADELLALKQRGEVRSYFKHTIVASEGDQAAFLFVILSGYVNLFVSDQDGKKFVVSTHGPGECIGETMLDGGPWPTSVETLESSRVWALARDDLLQVIAEHPAVALRFIQVISQRERALTDCTKSLALKDVYGRVVKLLGDMSIEHGGGRIVARHLTQDGIATRIGASREMVNRVMRDLTTGGYLRTDHGTITIVRPPPAHW